MERHRPPWETPPRHKDTQRAKKLLCKNFARSKWKALSDEYQQCLKDGIAFNCNEWLLSEMDYQNYLHHQGGKTLARTGRRPDKLSEEEYLLCRSLW